jgi:hypothetical protein
MIALFFYFLVSLASTLVDVNSATISVHFRLDANGYFIFYFLGSLANSATVSVQRKDEILRTYFLSFLGLSASTLALVHSSISDYNTRLLALT